MLIFAVILLFISAGLVVFALKWPSGKHKARVFGKPLNSPSLESQKKLSDKLIEEVASLNVKLKTVKEENARLALELEECKKNEMASKEELRNASEWIDKQQVGEDPLRREIAAWKEKFLEKDKAYEEQFSLNLRLKNESEFSKQKIESLEKDSFDLQERIRLLDAQNKAYKDELEKANLMVNELKKKDQDAQWVSKKEYDNLKAKLDSLEGKGNSG